MRFSSDIGKENLIFTSEVIILKTKHFSQCGNDRIFLLFGFYVKLKLANIETQNLPFQHI